MYLTREDCLEIISGMQNFESRLKHLFGDFNYDLHENLGRRNMLLSGIQEKETARVLRKKFKSVLDDGTPGKPDVVICDIDKELECKLTSGSRSNGTVSYSFQTDYATIQNKEKLDYIFLVANDDFTEFCALFFEGLTADDYFPPASGSRGKSRMNKHKAMTKVKPLVGNVINISEERVEQLYAAIVGKRAEKEARLKSLQERLESVSDNAIKLKEKTEQIIINETERYDNSIAKLYDSISYWANNPKYSLVFEKIGPSETNEEAA